MVGEKRERQKGQQVQSRKKRMGQEGSMIECVLSGGGHEIKRKMKMTKDGAVESVEQER
jgi:hypothetical protein